jgi:two-component system, OmpR family, sensor histidine kinase KdpD
MRQQVVLKDLGYSSLFFGVILLLTWIAIQIGAIANAITVGFTFLILVLLSAIISGQRVAIITSIMATLCFDYFFLPPQGTLRISDPDNWVALIAFLIVSITVGHYTSVAAESEKKRKELEKGDLNLARFVSRLSVMQSEDLTLTAIAEEVKRTFGLDSCSIHLHESGQSEYMTGSSEGADSMDKGPDSKMTFDRLADDAGQGVGYFAIDTGTAKNGVLVAKTAHVPAETLKAAAALIGVVLKQYREKNGQLSMNP